MMEVAFQFQSGAIKGFGTLGLQFAEALFQFQSGAIKGKVVLPVLTRTRKISIPIWCD